MPSDSFIFKKGKYAGKTYGLVKMTNPGYITWAEENAPGLLKESKPLPERPKAPVGFVEPPDVVIQSAIQPNMNFWNEKSTNY